jgi:hypothetical protein
MDGGRYGSADRRHRVPLSYRGLLALPLAFGAGVAAVAAARALGEPGQAGANVVFLAASGVAYAVGAALVLHDGPRRAAWVVLLASGVTLLVVVLVPWSSLRLVDESALDYASFLDQGDLLPVYLIALAAVQLAARKAPPARADRTRGQENAHVQL